MPFGLFRKKSEPEPEEQDAEEQSPYECAFCGEQGADKKFGGQNFHKKCLRKARKMAKSVI